MWGCFTHPHLYHSEQYNEQFSYVGVPMILPFLTVVNNLLIDVGESDRPDLSSIVSRKCVTQFNAANRTCSLMHKWWHLAATAPALSWTGTTATLPPHSKLAYVRIGNEELQQCTARASNDIPRAWFKVGSNTVGTVGVKVSEQPTVLFSYQSLPPVYSLSADSVDLPDYYYDCVYAYTKALLHQVHTTDSVAHDQCISEFQQLMHNARTQETNYAAPFSMMR
jgi:hypothetical protein